MRIVTIRRYEMLCLSRWGWHTFRNEDGRPAGFRFLGIGLAWNKQVQVVPYHTLPPLSDEKVMVNYSSLNFRDGRQISVGTSDTAKGLWVRIVNNQDEGTKSVLCFRLSEEAACALTSLLSQALR